MSDLKEKIAREIEPLAWAALGTGDTLAYKNRRTSSLRKADRILAIPAIEEALAGGRDFPTQTDCRFGIIDRKNGELLAAFDLDWAGGPMAAGDTITLPPFKLTTA